MRAVAIYGVGGRSALRPLDGRAGVIRRELFASMAGVAMAALLGVSAVAAERSDVFTLSIPVDATAASASLARDVARLQGEHQAYTQLLDRITLARDRARLPTASDSDLNDLIQGFEVAHERRSTVRYLADYTFHFRADVVEQRLRAADIPFAVTMSKPLVVLAVLETEAGPVLWQDPNPWREAWGAAKLPLALVPLMMPLGDIEDVAAINAQGADGGDDARLQALSANYAGADVLVARATIKQAGDSREIDVTSTRFVPGDSGAEQTWVASYAANPGESDPDFLARAIAGTVDQVEDAWKQANIIDYHQTGSLVVSVPITDLKAWLAIRDRIGAILSIQQADLLSLDKQRALVALHYVGDAAQLKLALAQRNLDLSGSDPDWVLQRHSAAPPPATPAPAATPAPPANGAPSPAAAPSSAAPAAEKPAQ
jgi:Uncharacterized protein conserved in bacteria (DUF2066)